jgi:hypothetical protein
LKFLAWMGAVLWSQNVPIFIAFNPPRPPRTICRTFRPPPAQWLNARMVGSLSYVAHESAAKLHPWPNSLYATLQNYFWDPLWCLGKVLKNMRSNLWQLYQSLLGYEFPPDPPSFESPNVQKTIFKGKSSLTCLFSKTVSAGIVIDRIDLNLLDAFSRLKNG